MRVFFFFFFFVFSWGLRDENKLRYDDLHFWREYNQIEDARPPALNVNPSGDIRAMTTSVPGPPFPPLSYCVFTNRTLDSSIDV